jgi:aspartyl-tRNA synthetase
MFDEIITIEQNAVKNTTLQMNESLKLTSQSQEANRQIVQNFKDMMNTYKESSQKIELNTQYLKEIAQALKIKENSMSQIASSLEGISAQNVDKIHQAIINNFEVMKKDTDQIGWSFNSHLNNFDEKFTNRLQDTLKIIDSEVAKIVSSLKSVKELES